jgi:hypothetical protein
MFSVSDDFLGKNGMISLYIKYRYQFFWMIRSKIAQCADSIFAIFSALVSAGDNCMIS